MRSWIYLTTLKVNIVLKGIIFIFRLDPSLCKHTGFWGTLHCVLSFVSSWSFDSSSSLDLQDSHLDILGSFFDLRGPCYLNFHLNKCLYNVESTSYVFCSIQSRCYFDWWESIKGRQAHGWWGLLWVRNQTFILDWLKISKKEDYFDWWESTKEMKIGGWSYRGGGGEGEGHLWEAAHFH